MICAKLRYFCKVFDEKNGRKFQHGCQNLIWF